MVFVAAFVLYGSLWDAAPCTDCSQKETARRMRAFQTCSSFLSRVYALPFQGHISHVFRLLMIKHIHAAPTNAFHCPLQHAQVSPEFNVTRTYLEWLTCLPWGVHSPESFDLKHAREVGGPAVLSSCCCCLLLFVVWCTMVGLGQKKRVHAHYEVVRHLPTAESVGRAGSCGSGCTSLPMHAAASFMS